MKSDETQSALISAEELTQMLPVSKQQLWRYCREGKLPSYRLGRRVLFNFAEVKEALRVPTDQVETNGSIKEAKPQSIEESNEQQEGRSHESESIQFPQHISRPVPRSTT